MDDSGVPTGGVDERKRPATRYDIAKTQRTA
jgi:hypothetical protein